MKNIRRSIASVLIVILLLGVFPVKSRASAEIWPGYPGVDELPQINTIPDPFKFFKKSNDPTGDGYVSSPEEWDARREEIKELVQRYWLGYRWPTKPEDVSGKTETVVEPYIVKDIFGTEFNVREEFDNLVENLLKGSVKFKNLIYGDWGPIEGEEEYIFGPADDEEEAIEMAIEAWNTGYYVPYQLWGFWQSYFVFRDYTGTIDSPPPAEVPVTYNTVTVRNPETGAEASFNINVRMPTVTQVVYAWEDYAPSVRDAVYWDDLNIQLPVIIDIGGVMSSHVNTVNEQGYAYISFTPTDIYADDSNASDGDGINRDGVYTKLYPYDKDVYEYASGALMAWGWGASQILNALEQPMEGSGKTWGEYLHIDPTRSLVIGHSRYGKAAMFAAAFDDRFDICIASEPGGSGIQSYRYKVEGKIFNFNAYPKADRVYGKTEIPTVSYGGGSSWFPETAGHFVNRDNQLPFDSSDIIALVAPRVFFALTGIDAHWLGNEGGVAAVQAASEVYAYIGKNEIEKTNIAIRARQSDHMLYNRDVPFIIAIMDREFKQTDDRKLHVQDLFPNGTGLGAMSYPARDYSYVSEFNSYPFDINSSYLPWSRPDKYVLWTAQENFLVGYPITITAYSNAPDVKLILPDGTEINPAKHEGEEFIFELNAEQAIYGRYELRTVGSDKENRSVFFSAVSLADVLRHGRAKGDEGEENRVIGFSSRLANSAENPPEVYVDGKLVTMSFTPERFKEEETTLLEYGIQFHDKLFARIANEGWDENKTFHIKNLKFVTIPDFTFEISFGNVYASANNNGKDGADRFTEPISWNVERYNNGPAEVWPEIPDNLEERRILESGGTVTRPEAPQPKPSNFDTKIIGTKVERDGEKINIIIEFDSELDKREFGFGLNSADRWDTIWSEDGKQVTLSVDYDKFPADGNAALIIFRLKDTEGNMIPGPKFINLSYDDPDKKAVDEAIEAIISGTYRIPVSSQANQESKTAWVQKAVNARIPEGNDSVAVVTFEDGSYKVTVSKGKFSRTVAISVTLETPEEPEPKKPDTPSSSYTPTPTPAPNSTVNVGATVKDRIASARLDYGRVKDFMARNITVKLPQLKGINVDGYSVVLPAKSLAEGNGEGILNVETAFGNIMIQDNMLANIPGISGDDEVRITVGTVNKDTLPEDVRNAVGERPVIELTLNVGNRQIDWNNPDTPVTVHIPYQPSENELENPYGIVIWYIDGNGNVITVPSGRYDPETGMVIFKTTHFSMFAVAYVEKNFTDLENAEWAIDSIKALAARDIIKTDGDSFRPSENITRADYLYALVRALNLNTQITDDFTNFDDISKDTYYYNEIAIAKKLGITLGTGNNKFSPDLEITRQEMMTLTARTLISLGMLEKPGSTKVLDSFTDKGEIASWAVESAAALVSEGLIVGSNNKIMPGNNTTRAEAAVFLYRLYKSYSR